MKSIMNKIRLAAFMATVAILAGRCEKKSDNAVDNTPVAARITSAIDGMATRAAGTAWAAGDAIGVTATSATMDYTNIKYLTTDGNGTFTPDGGADNNIYFQDKDDVAFTAYYPYSGKNGTAPNPDGKINKTISNVDQAPDAQPQIDYLFATATASSANPNVRFQFRHCMSRLTLHFQPGEGISSLSALEYTLGAFAEDGSFDTTTGKTEVERNSSISYDQAVPYNDQGMSSSLILYPQDINRADIKITMNSVDYKGTIDFPIYPGGSKQGMEPGKHYTYNIKVNNTSLTINPASIGNWEDGGSQDIPTTN